MSWINLGEVCSVLRRAVGEDDAAETAREVRAVVGSPWRWRDLRRKA